MGVLQTLVMWETQRHISWTYHSHLQPSSLVIWGIDVFIGFTIGDDRNRDSFWFIWWMAQWMASYAAMVAALPGIMDEYRWMNMGWIWDEYGMNMDELDLGALPSPLSPKPAKLAWKVPTLHWSKSNDQKYVVSTNGGTPKWMVYNGKSH